MQCSLNTHTKHGRVRATLFLATDTAITRRRPHDTQHTHDPMDAAPTPAVGKRVRDDEDVPELSPSMQARLRREKITKTETTTTTTTD